MEHISCHRKYAIVTNFLDTMLEHSVYIREGETKLDAYRRGLKELDQIAADLRKEHEFVGGQNIPPPNATPYDNGKGSVLMVIDKSFERLEIDIDNAESLEDLNKILLSYDKLPDQILTQIQIKKENFKL